MTHENKEKFWFFYTKENPDDDNSPYMLYAFTDNADLAKQFMKSRCMEKFYLKTGKLDRANYNELINHHLQSELHLYEGYCRLDSSMKANKFELPLTLREELRVMQNKSIYLHEKLFRYVWDKIGILKDKYLEALVVLGYPMLQTYVFYGENPISRTVEDALLGNDMNILLEEFGWSFVPDEEE